VFLSQNDYEFQRFRHLSYSPENFPNLATAAAVNRKRKPTGRTFSKVTNGSN
jgi:hypothetical protein